MNNTDKHFRVVVHGIQNGPDFDTGAEAMNHARQLQEQGERVVNVQEILVLESFKLVISDKKEQA